MNVHEVSRHVPRGQDWLAQTWCNGSRTVQTMIPPKHAADGSILYDTDGAAELAERILAHYEGEMKSREINELKAENALLNGEMEKLLAKLAEAWAERTRLQETVDGLLVSCRNLQFGSREWYSKHKTVEAERDALQSFVDDDAMFDEVIAENRALRSENVELKRLYTISKNEEEEKP